MSRKEDSNRGYAAGFFLRCFFRRAGETGSGRQCRSCMKKNGSVFETAFLGTGGAGAAAQGKGTKRTVPIVPIEYSEKIVKK